MPPRKTPVKSAAPSLEVTYSAVKFSKDGGAWCVSEADSHESGARAGGKIIIVGPMLDPRPGWRLKLLDTSRASHPTFGPQIKYKSYQWIGLSDANGLRKYLAALCEGIGTVTAGRIVDAFGDGTLTALRDDPDGVHAKVPALRLETARLASAALKANAKQEAVQVLLRAAGCGDGRVATLLKASGGPDALMSQIQENPWALAERVDGIGFKIADALAIQAGHAYSAPKRARAALMHLVSEACNQEGNTWISPDDLGKAAAAIKIPPDSLAGAVAGCPMADEVEKLAAAAAGWDAVRAVYAAHPIVRAAVPGGVALAPMQLWRAELSVRVKVHGLLASGPSTLTWDDEVCGRFAMDSFQADALAAMRLHRVAVVTGPPGVGKSWLLEAIYAALTPAHSVAIMAPTGKAAARIREMGVPASTIHRALGWGSSQPIEDGTFEADVVIADESSMIDAPLMAQLLRALKPRTHVYLFGDADQLPPVGAGMPFRDIISSGAVPVARLQQIHRQRPESWLAENCKLINAGKSPYFANGVDDCFLEETRSNEETESCIVNLVARRLPPFCKCASSEIQVLSPKNMGPASVDSLNQALRAVLNPTGKAGLRGFREGDKVIHTKNNYEIGIMNGEVGVILRAEKKNLWIDFDGNEVEYGDEAAGQLKLAYAISIHRSQGSGFPVVVVPITKTHSFLWNKQMLYVAMSRAKSVCVLVGTKEAIRMAVHKPGADARNTFLAAWLREDAGRRKEMQEIVEKSGTAGAEGRYALPAEGRYF